MFVVTYANRRDVYILGYTSSWQNGIKAVVDDCDGQPRWEFDSSEDRWIGSVNDHELYTVQEVKSLD